MKKKLLAISLGVLTTFFAGCVLNQPKGNTTGKIDDAQKVEQVLPNVEENKSYNEDGSIREIQYLKDGIELESFIYDYYPSGKLNVKLRTVNDVFNGRSEAYYESGKLLQYQNYINGLKSGEYAVFYESGQVRKTGKYDNDKLNGIVKEFNENGNIESQIFYTEGIAGVSIYYEYKDGILEWEKKFNNNALVESKKYYPDGNLEIKADIENGEIHGIWEEYYNNGNIKKRTTYSHGKETG